MTQKKNPNLRIVRPSDEKEENYPPKKKKWWKWILAGSILLIFLILLGSYLVLSAASYTSVYQVASYVKETSENNRYAAFRKGVVRYGRNGVALLNRKNEEVWISSSQFVNPVIDISNYAFAVGDSGGNAIQVFTETGLKGEIETTLPVEKFSVSDQGVVSVILKDETTPRIVTYDATGNILVQNEVMVEEMGYPIALDMSPDGTKLAVAYLRTADALLESRVVYYHFGAAGQDKENHEVSVEEYTNCIIPEVFFMNAGTSVAVSDHSFIIYEGEQIPAKKREVEISQEIKSIFHTKKYIGFVLLNPEKSGYEVRLYNRNGKQVLNRTVDGEYGNVRMTGNEIVMHEGSRCCIITDKGVERFKGTLDAEALAVVPVNGLNKYLVISENELQVIYLTK